MRAIGDLLDVNVWLAFAVEGHQHHEAALKAWAQLNRPSFCRLTQLGLMRLFCNREVMGHLTVQPEEAWGKYEQMAANQVVHFVDEPARLEATLKLLLKGAKGRRDFWTDTYLAAFAQAARMRLVSFDTDFTRFQDLDCLILENKK